MGRLALPMLVLSIAMHHLGVMPSWIFNVAVLIAGAVAAFAVLLSVTALVRLWFTGDRGWGDAFLGLFIGSICLLPFLWYGQIALRTPAATDIATTNRDSLPLVFDTDTASMPPPKLLTPEQHALYYPTAVTHNYGIAASELYALAMRLVEENGWSVRLGREPSDLPGRINARATTLLGWREEIVLIITPTVRGAKIDMRSASIGGLHDFGSNGARIERFFVALDNEVAAFIADNPNVPSLPDDDEAVPEVITGGN